MSKASVEQLTPFRTQEGFRIIFVNGHFDAKESKLPAIFSLTHIDQKWDGVRRDQLQEVVPNRPNDAFENLNIAGM